MRETSAKSGGLAGLKQKKQRSSRGSKGRTSTKCVMRWYVQKEKFENGVEVVHLMKAVNGKVMVFQRMVKEPETKI